MLGIIKAGGRCVGLSPGYPMPRMMSILEDIKATIVLVTLQYYSLFEGIVPYIIKIEPTFIDSLPSVTSDRPIQMCKRRTPCLWSAPQAALASPRAS